MAKVFCSYSHKDERMRQQLETHLSALKRQGSITLWSDRIIRAGDVIDDKISENLEVADIVLLLVSAEFIASNYCYEVELRRALELHELGKLRVVPVILRDCDWHRTPFGKLLAVPTDGRPVKSWPDRDKAYLCIVNHLRRLIDDAGTARKADEKGSSGDLAPEPMAEAAPVVPELDLQSLAARGKWIATSRKSMAGAPPAQSMRHLGQLLTFANDLDRLAEDKRQAQAGGKINYVFDTNICQMFLEPRRGAIAMSAFQPIDGEDQGERSGWLRIDEQSALLTSEYLFSGSLPGQADGLIYLTPWHRVEVLHQIEFLARQVWEQSHDPDRISLLLSEMAGFRANMAKGIGAPLENAHQDRQLAADIESLREAGVTEDQLRTYLTARLTLLALLDAEPITTLCQMQRFASPQVLGSIRNAQSLAEICNSDRDEIAEDANRWAFRISQELELRGERRQKLGRQRVSVWDDASSIALVHGLSRLARDNEMTVLVTGDALLFSAYRRWYADSAGGQPFLLRRTAQYAPVLTLGDRDLVHSPSPAIVEQFIDYGLLPFNLSSFAHRDVQNFSDRTRLREGFSRQLADGAAEPRGPSATAINHFLERAPEWSPQFVEHARQLGIGWRQVESITLGLNPDLISYRLSSIVPDELAFREISTALTPQEIETWLGAALASLERGAINLWLPLAIDTIWRGLAKNGAGDIRGAQLEIAFGYEFEIEVEGQSSRFDVRQIVLGFELGDDEPRVGGVSEEVLLANPILAFALAALLDLNRGYLAEASRFAKLCVQAADAGRSQSNAEQARRLAVHVAGSNQEVDSTEA